MNTYYVYTREERIGSINAMNPGWVDLAEGWFDEGALDSSPSLRPAQNDNGSGVRLQRGREPAAQPGVTRRGASKRDPGGYSPQPKRMPRVSTRNDETETVGTRT